MRCIFLDGDNCRAIPPNVGNLYKPDEKEQTDLCNSNKFGQCPRFIAIIDYVKAVSKPSH